MNLGDLRQAARRLAEHPQDHGWREFFRIVRHGLESSSSELIEVLAVCARRRAHSPSHLINLLGIAIKAVSPEAMAEIQGSAPTMQRMSALESVLDKHATNIISIICDRRNSFTGARRHLVPQVILGAYFGIREVDNIGFADFGTGLGILPRQINCETLYRRFSPDLPWPGGVPRFRKVPIARSWAVDCGPAPDLAWVRTCYGSSSYYADLLEELMSTLDVLDTEGSPSEFQEVDLLDTGAVAHFLREHPVHAGNLSYVLYEIDPKMRNRVLTTVRAGLRPPGLLIVTEPNGELSRPGCTVEVYCQDRRDPYRLCAVSDGHFKGEVTALRDYSTFFARHPILID